MVELKQLTLLLGNFIDSNYPVPIEQRPKVRNEEVAPYLIAYIRKETRQDG